MIPAFLTDLLPIFLKIVLTVGAALTIFGIAVLVVILLVKRLRVKADREHVVKLINTGNCQSKYHLWAESTEPELSFGFRFNQIPLAFVEELIEEVVEESREAVPTKSDKKKEGKKTVSKSGDALKSGQAVAAKTGAAASLMGTLASILPGKMGAGLKSQAEAARNIQTETAKATQAPKAAQRKMDSLKQSSGKLGVKADVQKHQGSNVQADEQDVFESAAQSEVSGMTHKVRKVVCKSESGTVMVQTMEVGPGEKLAIALQIGKTKKRYPTGSFSYTVWSQQVAVDDRYESAEPVAKSGLVSFTPIGAWRYLLPGVCSVLVLLFALFGVISVIPLIWG